MIDVVLCRCTGMGVSLHDVLQSISLASGLVVSIRVVLTLLSYAWVSASLRVVWMLSPSSRVSAFEFATMYTSRLYFEGWVPCDAYVCEIMKICWM